MQKGDRRHSEKPVVRRFLLDQRLVFPSYFRDLAAQSVAARVCALPEVCDADVLVLYQEVGGELPTGPLLEQFARRKTATIVLPAYRGGQWVLAVWNPETDMAVGRYSILTPRGPQWQPVGNESLVVFAPLVGWDRTGFRLGRGGGVYDRLLQRLTRKAKPFAIGLGYEAQYVAGLHRDAWDVPMDLIVTERRVVRAGGVGETVKTGG